MLVLILYVRKCNKTAHFIECVKLMDEQMLLQSNVYGLGHTAAKEESKHSYL